MNLYTAKEAAVLAYVAGLLSGMVVAFASCSGEPDTASQHITVGGRQ